MTTPVAALYVDPRGHYPTMPYVDAWDERRDARLYAGWDPVVAHPPCRLWINLAALNYKRYGGEHNRPGNDGGAFASALANVRRCGGVLEHPRSTNAWAAHGLVKPTGIGWSHVVSDDTDDRGYWVCEVWQSAYGYLSTKRTWILYVGAKAPLELDWSRVEGTHAHGWWKYKTRADKPKLRGANASRTPPAFAEALVALARHAVE